MDQSVVDLRDKEAVEGLRFVGLSRGLSRVQSRFVSDFFYCLKKIGVSLNERQKEVARMQLLAVVKILEDWNAAH